MTFIVLYLLKTDIWKNTKLDFKTTFCFHIDSATNWKRSMEKYENADASEVQHLSMMSKLQKLMLLIRIDWVTSKNLLKYSRLS